MSKSHQDTDNVESNSIDAPDGELPPPSVDRGKYPTTLDNLKPAPAALGMLLDTEYAVQHDELGDEITNEKPRMKRWEFDDLVQKPARANENFPRALDVASDLVASNLGGSLNLPVVWQVIAAPNGEPVSLFSPAMAIDGVDISDPDDYVNGEQLSQVLVFEEWILNTDDKQAHFCAVETESGQEFRVLDHGHTLLQTLYRQNDGEIDGYRNIDRAVGKNPYPFSSAEEVEDDIELIESVTDEMIDGIIDYSFAELRQLNPNDEDFVEFLANAEEHRSQIQRVLRQRRDNIQVIIEDKL